MKFPNHLVLDLYSRKNALTPHYWCKKYCYLTKHAAYLNMNLKFYSYFCAVRKMPKIFFLSNHKKFTISYMRPVRRLQTIVQLSFLPNFFKAVLRAKLKGRIKLKTVVRPPKPKKKIQAFSHRFTLNLPLARTLFRRSSSYAPTNALWQLFDINFLKKEKLYTKLKYSRVPQYDIVSGGSAALFAGFLGFLICEKFGFELLDSGDFYFLFMYLVFLVYFLRLIFKLQNAQNATWALFTPKHLALYCKVLILFTKNSFSRFFFYICFFRI